LPATLTATFVGLRLPNAEWWSTSIPAGVKEETPRSRPAPEAPQRTSSRTCSARPKTLEQAWRTVPDAAWVGITRDVSGLERPLHALPARRWQELEVHLVDLDIGVSHRDWSDDFVTAWLPKTRAVMTEMLPAGVELPDLGDPRDELAWLYGRLRRKDLPALPAWG
jgi:hypothetical protein